MQGWNLAFKDTVPDMSGEEMERRIKKKLGEELWFLDGATWNGTVSYTHLTLPTKA